MDEPFDTDIAQAVWETKYRYREDDSVRDDTIIDSWWRIAGALSEAEESSRDRWKEEFFHALSDFRFLPGGRIQAGAGTRRDVTLYNCFVMGTIEDSLDGIFSALKEGALTMQQGGGVGYDFSTLRPAGTMARRVGSTASGPVSFMHTWDAMCTTLTAAGNRRGAMMACLRCDHPDIERFIDAKHTHGKLTNFNLSVLATDAFMEAVDQDGDWPLVFPDSSIMDETSRVMRRWPGYDTPVPCRIYRTVRARDLWQRIMHAAYDYAEPGILFIDQINRENNLGYCETLHATNPCGEIPLPPYGACNLGSINLTRFVIDPFSDKSHINFESLKALVGTAVRMLDDVIEVSRFPLPEQKQTAKHSRRIGLGITGLADALILLGLRYGSSEATAFSRKLMETICHSAYLSSIELARERGPFPAFAALPYLASPFVRRLPTEIRDGIVQHGIRNSHLTAIAPAGTISLLAGNVSSGLEPVFAHQYSRRMLTNRGEQTFVLEDYAVRAWRLMKGEASLPDTFVTAQDIPPAAHLNLQAALQEYVDNAISKTINIPPGFSFNDFESLYRRAYDLGLKGCTTFRPNPVTGEVLSPEHGTTSYCCTPEREAD